MQVYSPLCAQSIFNLSVYLRGTKGVRDLYPLSQHENSATVVAVASAGWWPLIGWLELYHGTASTLLSQSNLNVAVHPDLSLIRLTARWLLNSGMMVPAQDANGLDSSLYLTNECVRRPYLSPTTARPAALALCN